MIRGFILVCIVFTALAACTTPVLAYVVMIDAPQEVAQGIPLVVTGSTTFPEGTLLSVVLSQANTAGSETARKTTFVDNERTFAVTFDTASLQPGKYKVEIRPDRSLENRIGSGSTLYRLVTVTDRVRDIEITSPRTIVAGQPLVISGSIRNLATEGLQARVVGPEGILFGPQYIALNKNPEQKTASFSFRVQADNPGNYFVEFFDGEKPIGSVAFAATPLPAASTVTTDGTTPPPAATTPQPAVTRAAAGPFLSLAGFILAVLIGGRRYIS